MIGIDPDHQVLALRVLFGLAVTMVLGMGVGCLVERVRRSIPTPPPSEAPEIVELWQELIGQTAGGHWIGYVEKPLFFAACWLQAWLLLTGWLVLKLGFYWQSANFAAFPRNLPDEAQLRWVIAKRQLGTHHTATALTGTGANILVALIGVAAGKWVTFQ